MARGITRDRDRHGNERLYFRKRGYPKIRLREAEGTDAFEEELACARLGIPYKAREPSKRRVGKDARAPVGTFRWLVEEYLVRKIAGQLGLSTADLVETKIRAREDFLKEEL